MIILGIDPGNIETAYCFYDDKKKEVLEFDKLINSEVLDIVENNKISDLVAIEMIASYGMPVGKTVFDTCLFIGEMIKACKTKEYKLITRNKVKNILCHTSKAKDSNIRQRIIDIFGVEATKKTKCVKCKGKGIFKKSICPLCNNKNSIKEGMLYGMSADMWSALAVCLSTSELIKNNQNKEFYKI